jgi:putative tricarboxylic transport membrane protein
MSASASLALSHVRSGAMRIIAVTAPTRMAGELASAPTLKEQGIDSVVNNFRLLIGPPGLTPAQVAYWDQVIAKLVQVDEWKKDLDFNLFENTYLGSRDVRRYLDTEYAELRSLLTAMGMAK